ncbi:hypothetical protein CMI48_01540 [Candidatus Pacearchaeota archaeon]|jgi:uncharacterized protein YuzE|nr:hypothetical protein [Candidatus Pacearchaeota archaeon]|tara:strand:- start:615 stop:815 length:201 start_codon:yes stop_codon:yes gene_type:complete
MRIDIDKEADAAYLYFKNIAEGEVKTTISLNDDINVDLDSEGKTIGIEILEASKNLPQAALKQTST